VKEIIYKGKTIQYKLVRRKGSRRVTLSVRINGLVVVSRPWWMRESLAHRFVLDQIEWIYTKTKSFETVDTNLATLDRSHYLQHKEHSRDLVHKKLEYFNTHYNFEYHNVSIGAQTSRWGSCSSKKNLNFNYKILFLPEELQDYLIVHELVHLKEMNHGPQFWAVVSETIVDAKEKAKQLRMLTR